MVVIEEHYVEQKLSKILKDRFKVWVVPASNTYNLVVERCGFCVRIVGCVTDLEEQILGDIWGKVPHSESEAEAFAKAEEYNF